MSEFKPPPAFLGQDILWYPYGDVQPDKAIPAKVTGVGDHTLAVSIFGNGNSRMETRDGVRHANDPRKKSIEVQDNGCWSYTPEYVAFLTLQVEHKELKATVRELQQQLAALQPAESPRKK